MNRDEHIEALAELPHGGRYPVGWCGDIGGIVYRLWDIYVLFDDTGNIPQFAGTFYRDQVDEMMDVVESWP